MEKNKADELVVKDKSANPAPLGLLGFALATILLNLHNAGFYPMNSMILSMGFFYGGLAQIVAGAMEWKKGNTFGTTAFLSYGLFWVTLVGLILMPKLNLAVQPDPVAMGSYLLMWGIFTFSLFIGTLRINFALQFVFFGLTILFILLALGDLTGNALITQAAGYEGMVVGVAAFYTAIAQILNELYGKVVLPLWPVRKD